MNGVVQRPCSSQGKCDCVYWKRKRANGKMCRLSASIFKIFLITAGFTRSLCQVESATKDETLPYGLQGSPTQQLVEYQVTTVKNTSSMDNTETPETTPIPQARFQSYSNENEIENSTRGNMESQQTTVHEVLNSTEAIEPSTDEMEESTTFAWYPTAIELKAENNNRDEYVTTTDKYTETTNEGIPKVLVTTEELVTTTASEQSHLIEILVRDEIEEFTTIPETDETTTIEVDRETEIAEDFVEKQINEAINSMPKLPELVLSDNKTHFKFHKNSEEMLIDEKITQIARQLAEKSLREQYEERKLGHSSLKKSKKAPQLSEESKPYKLKKAKVKPLLQSKFLEQSQQTKPSDTITVSTLKKSSPTKTIITTETSEDQQEIYEKITNLPFILKLNKTDVQIKEISEMLKLKSETPKSGLQSIAPIPITFRTTSTSRNTIPTTTGQSLLLFSLLGQEKPKVQARPNNTTFYVHEVVTGNGTDV